MPWGTWLRRPLLWWPLQGFDDPRDYHYDWHREWSRTSPRENNVPTGTGWGNFKLSRNWFLWWIAAKGAGACQLRRSSKLPISSRGC